MSAATPTPLASEEPTDLTKLFGDAGVHLELGKFIMDMGINTVAVFARIALSPEELRSRVIQPFISASKETDPVRQILAEATVTAAWDAANRSRTALTVAATVAAAAAPSPNPTLGAMLTSTSTTTSVPTALKPGIWEARI